jgi:hypothetical protein
MIPIGLRLARVLAATGVAAVAGSCLMMSDQTAFPGWLTLIPTCGAALVIAAEIGARGGGGLMGWAPVQWVGDHSYSMYLWHWPPLVALPWILHEELGDGVRLGVLAATVLLAWVTKALVEDPVRSGRRWKAARWPSFGLAAVGMCVVLAGTTAVNAAVINLEERASASTADRVASNKRCFGASALVEAGCQRPYTRPGSAKLAFASQDTDPMQHSCQLGSGQTTEPVWCEWAGADRPTRTIAVVGNSFAIQMVPMLKQWIGHRRIRILLAARTECLGVTALPVTGQPADDLCPVWSAKVQSRLLAMDDLAAVLFSDHAEAARFVTGQQRPSQRALPEASSAVEKTLRAFRRARIPTAVVQRPPGHPSQPVPECIAMSTAGYDPCAVPRRSVTEKSLLALVASEHPGLTRLISLDRFLCDRKLCHATVGGVVAYKDQEHLTAAFSRTLARPLDRVLDELASQVKRPRAPRGS